MFGQNLCAVASFICRLFDILISLIYNSFLVQHRREPGLKLLFSLPDREFLLWSISKLVLIKKPFFEIFVRSFN